MNRTKLKAYAPKARRDFIQAVTDRAAYYGLIEDRENNETIIEEGDVAIIGGRAFPRAVAAKRKRLEERIKQRGFDQVMEAMAYTWFNRLAAIRYMELHGFLDHGYRVLSHPEGKAIPEIVEHAEHVDLPGLDREKVIELKIEGTRESELYGMLLLAQCHALHQAMPFLFEEIDDETELLLPENLLHSDSLIRRLVNEVPEEDWGNIEIIGWLYQFYISEKKDQVIGKVVKSEDIPAATQLFTPNWIVKYMVQNSLGRQWLATYPNSPLKKRMEYYIETAEQTPEVQEQLKAITPESLNPEEMTFLDPACGSGHILVEAYDLYKAIYQERGYRAKDIPQLILEKNLFGLEIDDRAAQLASFALMMRARGDDRRIFESGIQPHVMAIQDSKEMDAGKITEALNVPILKSKLPSSEFLFEELEEAKTPLFSRKNLSVEGNISKNEIGQLIDLFEHGKTFGSLIHVSEELVEKLPEINKRVNEVMVYGDIIGKAAAKRIEPIIYQANILRDSYHIVVTNPPYLNNKGMNQQLKLFLRNNYSEVKSDLFSAFMMRNLAFADDYGQLGFMAPFVWMFIASYEKLRNHFIINNTLTSLVQLEYSGFEGATVPICSFVLAKNHITGFVGSYIRLSEFRGPDQQGPKTLEAISNHDCGWFYKTKPDDFRKIPGCPIAYWANNRVFQIFENGDLIGNIAETRKGMGTGNNERFVRCWFELDRDKIFFDSSSRDEAQHSNLKWFPYNDGGPYRKWYGNNESVVNWQNDGEDAKAHAVERNNGGHWSRYLVSLDYFFKPGITWTAISSSNFSARLFGKGFLFSSAGMCLFSNSSIRLKLLGALNSNVGKFLLKIICPTLNFGSGEIGRFPYPISQNDISVDSIVNNLIEISKSDWDAYESSWDFKYFPWLTAPLNTSNLGNSWRNWHAQCNAQIRHMQELETENNRIFIEAYGLKEELFTEVPEEQITLGRADRELDMKRLLSYSMGCLMGRYSLDKPGIIYAHSGNEEFDQSQYKSFPADKDGIIPITEIEWFEGDGAKRIEEFIGVAWPKEHLEENLSFITESLGSNQGESSRETIRRYLATGFFKHHLSMYKKRPIYWLFSSGKLRAFQCLVYLHRYNEGTLSRMRIDYVIPLQGKMSARIDQLGEDINKAISTSHRKKLEKEKDKLTRQLAELRIFDEKLRHYADQRISLDLDDGVKVNYGKFGDLLAEVKAVTGTSED
jgi:type II restriction/modification system DNA methylase subunit YeeA